jgi:hypothetical protein
MNLFEQSLQKIRGLAPFEQSNVMAKYSNTCARYARTTIPVR